MLGRSGVVFLRVEIVPLDNNIFTFTVVGKKRGFDWPHQSSHRRFDHWY